MRTVMHHVMVFYSADNNAAVVVSPEHDREVVTSLSETIMDNLADVANDGTVTVSLAFASISETVAEFFGDGVHVTIDYRPLSSDHN